MTIIIVFNLDFGVILYRFNYLILGYGNFRLVSARLSLGRHYPFTYYFQSSFRAVSEQFFN